MRQKHTVYQKVKGLWDSSRKALEPPIRALGRREAPLFRQTDAGVEACVEQLPASSGELLAPYCYAKASNRSLPWSRSTDLLLSASKRT